MKYDIASLNTPYRGMGRPLTHSDFVSEKATRNFNTLISCYFKYIALLEHLVDDEKFDELIEYYQLFRKYDINCEIIVYDNSPLSDVFGRNVKLLGIDIVHDMAESLLESTEELKDEVKERLNCFGLCSKLEDIEAVMRFGDCGDVVWEPCWVYHVDI